MSVRFGWLVGVAVLLSLVGSDAGAAPASFEVEWPARRVWVGAEGVEGIRVIARDARGGVDTSFAGPLRIEGLTGTSSLAAEGGVVKVPPTTIEAETLVLSGDGARSEIGVAALGGAWTLLPAFLAIALALITRQVLLSLFGGVFLGAALLHGSFWQAFPRSLDLVVGVTADPDKLKIITFTMLMGGLVGIISNNGGTAGIVDKIAKRATSARSGALATWGMGMLVFFDDYASSLLIGTTMRPVTDRFKISREKLSYIVDSTAAPISSLALISTWVGYEVSVLGDALKAAGIDRDPYEVFIAGISSRFYPIYALIFVFIVAWMQKDFGPMLAAERRAFKEGKLIRDGGAPLMDAGLVAEADKMKAAAPKWWMAAVPLVVLVGTVIVVLLYTGLAAAELDPDGFAAARAEGAVRVLGYILSNAASYDALVYAGAASSGVAFFMSARSMGLTPLIDAFVSGLRAMTLAVVVLCLAWSIGKVMTDLYAGDFVATLIGGALPAWSIGAITFVLAAVIAFATGTSWGTMAILFPISIKVVALHTGSPDFEAYLLGASSAILAGAVFGDHCSPISDTTILSSIACAADHVDHTRTQAAYSVVCGAVAIVVGYIPFGLGLPAWVSVVVGIALLAGILQVFGKSREA
ncbi:MAG: Na+/H+ antiporter NhaC family protein [Deltaproteobacteria bacterium]|jgi:Na+/H+ antiporter NhaC